MIKSALATDYDGTLARQGVVDPATLAALRRFQASGRKLILVTGRLLEDLFSVFPEVGVFDQVVAENGALLYDPKTRSERLLAPSASKELVSRLQALRVPSLGVGRSIVATVTPYEDRVADLIRELGLNLQIIFNKGAVMVLPAGISKRSGLLSALSELGLPPHEIVGVGDGENDRELLGACGFSVAVADALDGLKSEAMHVTRGGAGEGVVELIDGILSGRLDPEAGSFRFGQAAAQAT
jgi:HAD superfamily hydrolase (TIGR01484 family)